MKSPRYREQNDINWSKNEELCFKEYRVNWARRENVDIRVLADWEQKYMLLHLLECCCWFISPTPEGL